jgi:hypothetical protein
MDIVMKRAFALLKPHASGDTIISIVGAHNGKGAAQDGGMSSQPWLVRRS